MATVRGRLHYLFIVTLLLTSSSEGQIRLVGQGSTQCSGRVEVYHNKQWGTVCDDHWDLSDAQVVCRQMNCGAAVKATHSVEFGQGSGQIWLDDVSCSGSERSLTHCRHSGFGKHNCGHSEDAGVVCFGHIPKPRISMTSREVVWGQSVRVTCTINTQHSGGTFTLKHSNQDFQTSGSNPATFIFPRVTFDNNGPYHCVYQKILSGQTFSSPQSDSVTLQVTVELPQPTICVSSPDGGQQCSSDTVHITRGHSFVISCSVHSDVPEGLFVLIFSGSNSTVSEAAVNHSASFHFPVSQDEHQGNYSCVYQVTGPGQTYTSETAPIQIIIKLPLLLVVAPSVAGSLLLLSLVFLLLCLVLKKRSTDERSDTNVQAQMSDTAGNQYVEDSDEDEADYVNVDEPQYTETKMNSNQPMRSNTYMAPRSRTADSQDMADKVRFVKAGGACFVEENREDDDSSDEDDEGDYVNVTEINPEEQENIYQNFQVPACRR